MMMLLYLDGLINEYYILDKTIHVRLKALRMTL